MASNREFMMEKSYPCSICNIVFYIEENLLKHAKEHEKKDCVHCKKRIVRAQNLKYHQLTCEQNAKRQKRDVQHGGGANTEFKLVESALGNVMVLYCKPLNTANFDDVKFGIYTRCTKTFIARSYGEKRY